MKKIIIAAACAAMIFTSCNNGETSGHAHGGEEVQGAGEHNHGEAGLQLISYNQDFELYAEADPFVVGQASEILAHFTLLSDFSPLREASVTIRMISEGKEVSQSLDAPDRPGIYSFTITPLVEGPAEIIFDISYSGEESRLAIPDLMVYSDPHDAIHEADEQLISDPNAITFTKEQSWKVDFATEEIVADEFSQVIRTSALVRTAQNDRISIVARTAGIVSLSGDNIFEGTAVKKGDRLLVISGSELAAGNSYVKFIEARNNFEESEANYQRMKVLADDKIVTESAMLAAKRDFETAKALYESLQKNFEGGEQQVMSPINGFVEQIYVGNGDFVDAGQTLLDVARNERLVLMADIPQRFANNLKNIVSANIRNPQSKSIIRLDELNGSLSSYGKSANQENYLIPVRFEIDNDGTFIPGSFVELFIICGEGREVLSIPNGAILEEQGRFFVLVQLTPELFIRQEVVLGNTNGFRTEIIEGLKDHDRIVSLGAILVKLSQSSGALDPHAGHVH